MGSLMRETSISSVKQLRIFSFFMLNLYRRWWVTNDTCGEALLV